MVRPTTIQDKPVERTFEEICDHSRKVVGEIDSRRWIVGDDACEIETRYGQHTLESFAREIGMNKSTVAGWKRVAQYYPEIIRRKLFEELENLTYTFYKDALRLDDLNESIEWLERCSAEGWSADQAAHELTEKLGNKDPAVSIPAMIEKGYERDGMYILEVSIALEDKAYLDKAMHLKIKVID